MMRPPGGPGRKIEALASGRMTRYRSIPIPPLPTITGCGAGRTFAWERAHGPYLALRRISATSRIERPARLVELEDPRMASMNRRPAQGADHDRLRRRGWRYAIDLAQGDPRPYGVEPDACRPSAASRAPRRSGRHPAGLRLVWLDCRARLGGQRPARGSTTRRRACSTAACIADSDAPDVLHLQHAGARPSHRLGRAPASTALSFLRRQLVGSECAARRLPADVALGTGAMSRRGCARASLVVVPKRRPLPRRSTRSTARSPRFAGDPQWQRHRRCGRRGRCR